MILPGQLMMPMRRAALPGFVGAEIAGGSGSAVVTKPVGTQDGDFLIAAIASQTGANTFAPSGWTIQFSYDRINVFTKIASSEGGSFAFTGTGNISAAVAVYRHVSAINTGGASQTAVAPSVNATQDGILVGIFVNTSSGGATVTSHPSGMTQRVVRTSQPQLALYDQIPSLAGATGTKTIGWSASDVVNSLAAQIA